MLYFFLLFLFLFSSCIHANKLRMFFWVCVFIFVFFFSPIIQSYCAHNLVKENDDWKKKIIGVPRRTMLFLYFFHSFWMQSKWKVSSTFIFFYFDWIRRTTTIWMSFHTHLLNDNKISYNQTRREEEKNDILISIR